MDLLLAAATAAGGIGGARSARTGRMAVGKDQFVEGLKRSNVGMASSDAMAFFDEIDTDGSGTVDILEWVDFLSTRTLAEQPISAAASATSKIIPPGSGSALDGDSLKRLDAMLARASRLSEAAAKNNVIIMFDAEQTYLQPAIDHVVTRTQAEFNKDKAVVYNTYQAYLRDCQARLMLDIERSRRLGFCFGAKLVRGAYMFQERRRAADMGYRDPIHSTIEETHESYDKAWRMIVDQIVQGRKAEVMIASHNEASVKAAADEVDRLGLDRRTGGVAFGQLLGMCDYMSLALGSAGFAVYKYVPYGPIKEVVPYLVRRAEENSGMLSGVSREITTRSAELRYRMGLSSQ
jgi:proline dehydrogenase